MTNLPEGTISLNFILLTVILIFIVFIIIYQILKTIQINNIILT